MKPKKILCIFGTRPEAIKMAPVIQEARRHQGRLTPRICVTAQHREMLDQALGLFEIKPDIDLNLMRPRQSLPDLIARSLLAIDAVLRDEQPDWVLVQGDTSTAMAAGLAAYYRHVNIGHVEAGLRTHNKFHPFPEEINRRFVDALTDLYFAPTKLAYQNLRAEAVTDSAIRLTGNTVVDALLWIRAKVRSAPPKLAESFLASVNGGRLIVVTGHRRENFGAGIEQICLAICDLVEQFPDIRVCYPVHFNPNIQDPVHRMLKETERVVLLDPLPYASFVWLLDHAYLVLTDSGGVQEEAPPLGKPVLVMRETTERPEGVEAGNAILVGTTRERIVSETARLLNDRERYEAMAQARNPYGDGFASHRIIEALLES